MGTPITQEDIEFFETINFNNCFTYSKYLFYSGVMLYLAYIIKN